MPLLSSAESEIKKLIEQARAWAERLGKPVRAWVSDKQEAFVKTIAEVFPGTPHRYCKKEVTEVFKHLLDGQCDRFTHIANHGNRIPIGFFNLFQERN